MKLLGFNITKDIVNVDKENKKHISTQIEQRQKFRTREDIRKLELAIETAQNLVSYDREDLNRIYRRVLDDPMITSQWNTRKLKTQDKEFRILVNDEVDEELTKLFEAGWFIDYMDAMLDSKLWGFTLVEFGAIEDEKFIPYSIKIDERLLYFDAVTVIDRDYVKPELGIVTKQPGDSTGLSFYDDEFNEWLVFEGKTYSHGLLTQMAKYLLFKMNVLGNWSEWAEVFGMDTIIGKTDKQGNDRNVFRRALQNLGSMRNGLFGENDEIEYVGTTRQDAYKVYQELAKYVDEQISKLIFGQDVVSNNTGKVVGTVGENIANLYGDSDAKFMQRNINDKLIPLMIDLGFKGLENAVFEWDTTEAMTLGQKVEQDLNISQMGFRLDQDYIEKTYSVKLDEENPIKEQVLPPIQNHKPIRNIKNDLNKFLGLDVSNNK
jgi:phage gp29-like protein